MERTHIIPQATSTATNNSNPTGREMTKKLASADVSGDGSNSNVEVTDYAVDHNPNATAAESPKTHVLVYVLMFLVVTLTVLNVISWRK